MFEWLDLNAWEIRQYIVIIVVFLILGVGYLSFMEYVMDQTNPQIHESYPEA